MKRLILIVVLLFTAIPAFSDGTGTLITWPGWIVSSTEALYMGHKHTSFPLTYLFDGNPATSWVFSGKGKDIYGKATGYGITISRDEGYKPVTMDSIWIMNGYNKSHELFLRNNRIVELKLYVNEKFIKTVALKDTMGWHKISIPRQKVSEIELSFTKFVQGRDNDICVSEIAVFDRGNKIDLKMPKAVEFTKGDGDCGCGQEWYLMDYTGKGLVRFEAGPIPHWSPNGRYFAATAGGELWVVDSSTGKIIMKQPLFKGDVWSDIDSWKDENTVVVYAEKCIPLKTGNVDDYKTESYTKVVEINKK